MNAWLNSLPEITSRDSPIDPLHADDEGFVEFFTNQGRHNIRNYVVSRLLSSRWITLTIRRLEHQQAANCYYSAGAHCLDSGDGTL